MADNSSLTVSDNEELDDCNAKTPSLSTSFTITFEEDEEKSPSKLKKNKNSNMFVRRHIRTLSLPANNDRNSSKNVTDLRDVTDKNQNNVPLNDDGQKSVGISLNGFVTGTLKSASSSVPINSFGSTESINGDNSSNKILNDDGSGNESEGGTYTLDKNNRQVLLARKSIDQVFGIVSNNENSSETSVEKMHSKSKMIDEWMEQSVSAFEFTDVTSRGIPITLNSLSKSKQYVSKIPSPLVRRRILSTESTSSISSNSKQLSSYTEKKIYSASAEIKTRIKSRNSSSEEIDTESYLKETENIVVALQNRLQEELEPIKSTNTREKETNKYANTRFNRAFSLRRDKSKKVSPAPSTTAIPVRKKPLSSMGSKTHYSSDINGFSSENDRRNSLSKNPSRLKKLPVSSPSTVTTKNEHSSKKPIHQRSKTGSGGMRSSSSLSAQEIEFQNWKRRKNYDPLKAAAEDRKKRAIQSSISCAPSSAALSTEKEKSAPVKKESQFRDQVIIRSASFHGLRNKTKFERCTSYEDNQALHSADDRFMSSACLSNENSISSDIPDYDDDNDWVIPKPPSTSLQNTPPESVSSRLSLLSNPASCSSAFATSSPLSKVNLATLASITHLSQAIKVSVSSLNNCLRSDDDKVGSSETRENGSAANVVHTDKDHHFQDQKYDLCRNGVQYDNLSNDLSDEQLSADHQLRLTLDNLRHIQIAVQELQTACSRK